jgi:hypothetical protein
MAGTDGKFTGATKLFMFLLYFIDTFLIYIIMLLIMTYNGYLICACLLGLTLGYAVSRMKNDFDDVHKCCHADEKTKK